MSKVSLAILVSLSTLASAAVAQTDESGVIMSTDPQKVAEFEQHAQEVQAHQSEMPPARTTREHPWVRRHHPHVAQPAQ